MASVASSRVTGIAFLSATGMGSLVKMESPGLKLTICQTQTQVLLVVRQVEPEILAELLQLLLADVAGLGHEGGQRVAGHDAHQAEDDQRRQQQHRHGQQHPPEHVLVHGTTSAGPAYLSSQVRASVGDP